MTEDLKKRLDCLILLSCMENASEKRKLNIAVNCLGLREVARLIGKDAGNLSRTLKSKEEKKR